eukprot:SAG31_NODE_924_length_10963_cov_4.339286_2_plen_140_part_00
MQPKVVQQLVGVELHMPTLAAATAADFEERGNKDSCGGNVQMLASAALELLQGGGGCILKPAHGAGGQQIKAYLPVGSTKNANNTSDGDVADGAVMPFAQSEFLRTAAAVATGVPDSRTSWQLSHKATRAVLLQPLYNR